MACLEAWETIGVTDRDSIDPTAGSIGSLVELTGVVEGVTWGLMELKTSLGGLGCRGEKGCGVLTGLRIDRVAGVSSIAKGDSL